MLFIYWLVIVLILFIIAIYYYISLFPRLSSSNNGQYLVSFVCVRLPNCVETRIYYPSGLAKGGSSIGGIKAKYMRPAAVEALATYAG